MKALREQIDERLKAVAVPALRELGFRGSYPNFYRETHGHVDLLCFQFSGAGGKFVVELSFADAKRNNVYVNKEAPLAKLRVSQTTKRWRLGASGEHMDNWFSFSDSSIGDARSADQLAHRVATLIHAEAKAWWASRRNDA